MIGTRLVEEVVQAVALTHLVRNHKRVSLLLLASPESGKTTITTAAHAKHVCQVAVITGRSILKEIKDHPETEFLLFNDLTAIRAMSASAVNLLIVLLNQLTQGERGIVAFAGKDVERIERSLGILACLPFETFADHRARWRELGFVSRMIPFAYSYGDELIAEIKDSIDAGDHQLAVRPHRAFPRVKRRPTVVTMPSKFVRQVRHIADARAKHLGQLGIRLLQNYHALVRARALLYDRAAVTADDVLFLRMVDRYVSITDCTPLEDRRA